MNRIRKGDYVAMNTGKFKGQKGKVIALKGNSVLVEGLNIVKKHIKSNPNKQIEGSISQKESFVNVSNVSFYDPVLKKNSRIGFKYITSTGKKVRYLKSNGDLLD